MTDCACIHPDAFECLARRYNYSEQEREESEMHREKCECCCHSEDAGDDDYLDYL